MIRLFCIIIIVLLHPEPAYCYIDPGTGSMLFSASMGIISIIFFAVKSLISRIGIIFFSSARHRIKTGSDWNQFVIYSEGGHYWSVFEPVIKELINQKQRVLYYTSDEKDPGLSYVSENIKSLFIGRGNKAYARLDMLTADICLMTMPGLDVFHIKRSAGVKHYCHILHSPVDTVLYNLFSFDYFDSMLLTSEFQIKAIRHLEEKRGTRKKDLYVTGCTYLDALSSKLGAMNCEKEKGFTVLVSPSWGPNGIFKKYGLSLLSPLAESGLKIIIRPHPQSLISERRIVEGLKNSLYKYQNVEWDYSRENLRSMIRSDIMISDFSGIIFDYFFLFSRPVIYTGIDFDKRPYDLSDYPGGVWTFETLKEIGTKITAADFINIQMVIKNASKNRNLAEKIKKAKNTGYPFQGIAGLKSAEALLEIRKKL